LIIKSIKTYLGWFVNSIFLQYFCYVLILIMSKSYYLSIPLKQWASAPLFFKEWRVTPTFFYASRYAQSKRGKIQLF
jgi:hypothetical protein